MRTSLSYLDCEHQRVKHDGVQLIADGDVTLTAANDANADPSSDSFPAVVNHVIYFGEGVSARTLVRGFRVSGANNFVTWENGTTSIEPNSKLPIMDKGLFFYADGGGIKVFGRSYPTISQMEIVDNYVSPCGGGISVEHQGVGQQAVTISDCIFKNNRCREQIGTLQKTDSNFPLLKIQQPKVLPLRIAQSSHW